MVRLGEFIAKETSFAVVRRLWRWAYASRSRAGPWLAAVGPRRSDEGNGAGSFLHPTIAPWIFTMYRKTVTSQPRLYGALYRSQYKKNR